MSRRIVVVLLAAAVFVPLSIYAAGPNEREVKPQKNVQDKPDIWVLNFKFKDPRLISVDIPGRGKKLCWYLWYQVTNHDPKEGHTFYPEFELVALDKNVSYPDEVLPKVQDAIRAVEDPVKTPDHPNGYLDIKNSVTISLNPLPTLRPNAIPKPVTGVATWVIGDKPGEVSPDTNRFSIFVGGLSNGIALTDPIPPDTQPVVRRKTLQLNFRRLGDRYLMDAREIRFEGPAEWMYRASKAKVPDLGGAKKEATKTGS